MADSTLRLTEHKKRSFDTFLSATPTIKELTKHANVGTKWNVLGTMLELDPRRLQSIGEKNCSDTDKMIDMFSLWLTTIPTASRRQVLEALREDSVEANDIAHKYEKHLKELHQTTCKLCNLFNTMY